MHVFSILAICMTFLTTTLAWSNSLPPLEPRAVRTSERRFLAARDFDFEDTLHARIDAVLNRRSPLLGIGKKKQPSYEQKKMDDEQGCSQALRAYEKFHKSKITKPQPIRLSMWSSALNSFNYQEFDKTTIQGVVKAGSCSKTLINFWNGEKAFS